VSVCYETAEVEACAHFNAKFVVYSDISNAQTFENSSNQCSAVVFILKCLDWNNGSQLAVCRVADVGDRLLSQTR